VFITHEEDEVEKGKKSGILGNFCYMEIKTITFTSLCMQKNSFVLTRKSINVDGFVFVFGRGMYLLRVSIGSDTKT
jgi:hypothetical protein